MNQLERLKRLVREIGISADFLKNPPSEAALRKLSEVALEIASQAFTENVTLAKRLEGREIQV